MSDDSNLKVVIRHFSGAKANEVQQFGATGLSEIRFGRAPGCDVVYSSPTDEVVSRNHAAIIVTSLAPPTFVLEDRGSSNGTFLNGERINARSEILPDDKVMFGRNGPSFMFDVTPRPASMAARTRVIDVSSVSAGATRVMTAVDTPAAASAASESKAGTSRSTTAPPLGVETSQQFKKEGIGKSTLLHEIAKERSASNRLWLSALGGVVALGVIGGGGLYWKTLKNEQTQQNSIEQIRATAEEAKEKGRMADEKVATERLTLGMSPQSIVREYGPATAKIKADWRLFDQTTGRPIFQKVLKYKGKSYRLYAKMKDQKIVRYLTLDDEGRSNLPIGGQVEGTGFVISESGFLLTNKHLAAAWRLPFRMLGDTEKDGALIVATGNKKRPYSITKFDPESDDELQKWSPEGGGLIFSSTEVRTVGEWNFPDPSKNERRNFSGRDEALEVTFAGNRTGLNGSLVRYSNDSDAALIKIETPQPLRKVELEESESAVSSGDHVVVLGFPEIAAKTFAVSNTIENGTYKYNTDIVPQPYVTDGIVALVSSKMGEGSEKNVFYAGAMGDVIQLTINATGHGNSGGPVFNSAGKVIGLFTYLSSEGVTINSAAVPIKYGNALLKSQ